MSQSEIAETIQSYLNCRLPALFDLDPFSSLLPLSGHKSHKNHLNVTPQTWRRLENIYPIKIDGSTLTWIQDLIPEHLADNQLQPAELEGEEELATPCPVDPNSPWPTPRQPKDIRRLASWINNLPLTTVERILHLIYPEMREWGFSQDGFYDSDSEIFQYFLWSRRDLPSTYPAAIQRASKSVMVVIQPPWILSEQDIKDFANCTSFPPFLLPGRAYATQALKSKYRVWAKMWDACARTDSPWFILTSYNQWVFGAFAPGWSAAFISSVYNFDSHEPTAIASLSFWIASAMKLPHTVSLPKMPVPLKYLSPVSISPNNVRVQIPLDSESNWDGKSEDPASSAGGWSITSPAVSLIGRTRPIDRPKDDAVIAALVSEWMKNILSRCSPEGEAYEEGYQNPREIKNAFQESTTQGDWLVM